MKVASEMSASKKILTYGNLAVSKSTISCYNFLYIVPLIPAYYFDHTEQAIKTISLHRGVRCCFLNVMIM